MATLLFAVNDDEATLPIFRYVAEFFARRGHETRVVTDGADDTNAAMVGGIVALYTGWEGIPEAWRRAREEFSLVELP